MKALRWGARTAEKSAMVDALSMRAEVVAGLPKSFRLSLRNCAVHNKSQSIGVCVKLTFQQAL